MASNDIASFAGGGEETSTSSQFPCHVHTHTCTWFIEQQRPNSYERFCLCPASDLPGNSTAFNHLLYRIVSPLILFPNLLPVFTSHHLELFIYLFVLFTRPRIQFRSCAQGAQGRISLKTRKRERKKKSSLRSPRVFIHERKKEKRRGSNFIFFNGPE